jgi:hypothetical protein
MVGLALLIELAAIVAPADPVAMVFANASASASERPELGKVKAFGRCASGGRAKLPATLDEALAELGRLLNRRQTEILRASDSGQWHDSLGMALRNCWGLWNDGPLGEWFRKQGIIHPDNMSAIVLESFRRKLNGHALHLAGQIKEHQAAWKRAEEEYQKGTSAVEADYNIVDFREHEGWVSLHGKQIPHALDLVDPIQAQAGGRIAQCWKKFPRTEGGHALDTVVKVSLSADGRLATAEIVKTPLPEAHAKCLADALIGVTAPAHRGAGYVLEFSIYRE